MIKQITFFVAFLFVSAVLNAQLPLRKAAMGVRVSETQEGIKIDSVLADGSVAQTKISKGDIIISVNDGLTKTIQQYADAVTPIRTGDKIKITYLHSGREISETITAVEKPLIKSNIADVNYDWLQFRQGYLRVITYMPKGKKNVPAILLIPGYGCGSVENYPASYNGKLIDEWVKNGYAVVTAEKSGMGDSYNCAPCNEVDLQTDIESFDAAYTYMEHLKEVDKTKLFIWGHSMGGTIAPEVAKRHTPKGVMVYACVFRPWNEFLLEMHRVQKPLMEGLTYQQTEEFVRGIQPIYNDFFNHKKSPEELYQVPSYQKLVVSELGYKPGSNDMWGRHWHFWQQLDSLNLAETWSHVNCPVLVLHGTADYEQCSAVEPMLIKQTVNEAHPGYATQITIEGIDHFMMNSKDYKEAYEHFKNQEYNKGNFNYRIAEETLKWLKKISGE